MKWMTEQSLKALEFLKVMGKLILPHSQDQCSAPLCYTKGHIEAILQGTIQYAPSHRAPLPQPVHLCECPGAGNKATNKVSGQRLPPWWPWAIIPSAQKGSANPWLASSSPVHPCHRDHPQIPPGPLAL